MLIIAEAMGVEQPTTRGRGKGRGFNLNARLHEERQVLGQQNPPSLAAAPEEVIVPAAVPPTVSAAAVPLEVTGYFSNNDTPGTVSYFFHRTGGWDYIPRPDESVPHVDEPMDGDEYQWEDMPAEPQPSTSHSYPEYNLFVPAEHDDHDDDEIGVGNFIANHPVGSSNNAPYEDDAPYDPMLGFDTFYTMKDLKEE